MDMSHPAKSGIQRRFDFFKSYIMGVPTRRTSTRNFFPNPEGVPYKDEIEEKTWNGLRAWRKSKESMVDRPDSQSWPGL